MKREDPPDLLLAVVVLIVLAFAVSRTSCRSGSVGARPFRPGHPGGPLDSSARPVLLHERPAMDQPRVAGRGVDGRCLHIAGSAGLIALKLVARPGHFVVLWRALRRAGVFRPFAAGLLFVATARRVPPD